MKRASLGVTVNSGSSSNTTTILSVSDLPEGHVYVIWAVIASADRRGAIQFRTDAGSVAMSATYRLAPGNAPESHHFPMGHTPLYIGAADEGVEVYHTTAGTATTNFDTYILYSVETEGWVALHNEEELV